VCVCVCVCACVRALMCRAKPHTVYLENAPHVVEFACSACTAGGRNDRPSAGFLRGKALHFLSAPYVHPQTLQSGNARSLSRSMLFLALPRCIWAQRRCLHRLLRREPRGCLLPLIAPAPSTLRACGNGAVSQSGEHGAKTWHGSTPGARAQRDESRPLSPRPLHGAVCRAPCVALAPHLPCVGKLQP